MINIEKACITDAQLIHDMALIVFPETYSSLLSQDQLDFMLDWMYSVPNIENQMLNQGHTYYIAYHNGSACGYLSINQDSEHIYHLQKIYILPQFQGLHLGGELFKHAIAIIKQLHPAPCTMELNVNRNNKALGFYQHMGMHIAREGDFDIGNGFFMNDYIMAIDI